MRRAAREDQLATAGQQSTVDLALFLHHGIDKIYTFMRGMLAGISLWQIISTYMLLNQGADVFLGGYYMLGTPLQCLYFCLFAVSTVSVLDRYVWLHCVSFKFMVNLAHYLWDNRGFK